jgi:hypothetical protein
MSLILMGHLEERIFLYQISTFHPRGQECKDHKLLLGKSGCGLAFALTVSLLLFCQLCTSTKASCDDLKGMKGPGKYSAVETLIQPAFGLLCAQTCIRP